MRSFLAKRRREGGREGVLCIVCTWGAGATWRESAGNILRKMSLNPGKSNGCLFNEKLGKFCQKNIDQPKVFWTKTK